MNLLAPYSWIKEFLRTEFTSADFAKQMSLIGNSVERQHRADRGLDHIVVGYVLEVHPHPNADALRVAIVEIAPGDERRIVCGGENLAGGQTVAVALPGAKVLWHGTDEAEIAETTIRGEASYGMICAAEEIGFPQLAKGKNIWDFTQAIDVKVPSGTPLACALDLEGDVVFDIEVTTNRPDCMAMVGQAREAYAAMLGDMEDPLASPLTLPTSDGRTQKPLSVRVDDAVLCPRYMGVVLEVSVGPSPWWMQKRLLLAGAKPINNVVDVTNYVRLELGQPLHAFDYDHIEGASIVVRRSSGEKIVALDDETYNLAPSMLVIADATRPVAIAGVMGGRESGVTDATATIILEAATFDPLSIRRTWRALGLPSDSQALYEKGVSSALPAYGLARAVDLLKEIAGARVVSEVVDCRAEAYHPRQQMLQPERVNGLIGVIVDEEVQTTMLRRLGFTLEKSGVGYKTTVPFWRDNDIEADVDLTEEIARLYGYHNLPSTLPGGVIPRREREVLLDREQELKDLLVGAGYTELYSNSFVDPADMRRAGFDPGGALRIANPLSEDTSFMRTSLLPSVLRALVNNQQHVSAERLFELQRVYLPREGDLPEERSMLMVAMTEDVASEHIFRLAKGIMDTIGARYHFAYMLKREEVAPWTHVGRAASIWVEGQRVGSLGEVHPMLLRSFGIDRAPVLIELDLPALLPFMHLTPSYQSPAAFPSALRDLALIVDEAVEYEAIMETMKGASSLVRAVELFDLYRGTQVPSGRKSFAIHLSFAADDRTLISEEVDEAMRAIVSGLEVIHGAIVRE